VIVEETKPRYIVRCDGCDTDIGSDDSGGSFLFESRDDALRNAEDWQWLVDKDGKVTCESCQDDTRIAAEDRAAEVSLRGEERVAELEKEANRGADR
jgi:hypothetical protein